MSSETDSTQLQEAIDHFRSAETVLADLATRRQELLEAAEQFRKTDQSIEQRSRASLDALAEMRARIREQIEQGEIVTRDVADVSEVVRQAMGEARHALELLQKIDSERLHRDMDEIRRETTEHGAELRESRRALNDIDRRSLEIERVVRQTEEVVTALRPTVDSIDRRLAEASDTVEAIRGTTAELQVLAVRAGRHLRLLTWIAGASMVAACAAAVLAAVS